jgi:hypothetical protein
MPTTTTTATTVTVTINGNVTETVTTTRTTETVTSDPAPAASAPPATAPAPPATAPAPPATASAPGRRPAGAKCRASRIYGLAERDRVGYGIPRDTASPAIRNEFMKLMVQEGMETRADLDEWCGGPRKIKTLYMYLKDECPNHWYSSENRESAQSKVRTIVLKALGPKAR